MSITLSQQKKNTEPLYLYRCGPKTLKYIKGMTKLIYTYRVLITNFYLFLSLSLLIVYLSSSAPSLASFTSSSRTSFQTSRSSLLLNFKSIPPPFWKLTVKHTSTWGIASLALLGLVTSTVVTLGRSKRSGERERRYMKEYEC